MNRRWRHTTCLSRIFEYTPMAYPSTHPTVRPGRILVAWDGTILGIGSAIYIGYQDNEANERVMRTYLLACEISLNGTIHVFTADVSTVWLWGRVGWWAYVWAMNERWRQTYLPVQTDRYDVVGWLGNLQLAEMRAATWAVGRYILAYDICLNATLLMVMFYDDHGGTETRNERILQLRLPNLHSMEQYLWDKQHLRRWCTQQASFFC